VQPATQWVLFCCSCPRRRPCRVKLPVLARIYREMESGKRESQNGSRLVYVLTQIAKVLDLTEIEAKIKELETRANGRLSAPTGRN
jgi:NADH:ubiquinone oxidoreductase subunit F (NADH-binding)